MKLELSISLVCCALLDWGPPSAGLGLEPGEDLDAEPRGPRGSGARRRGCSFRGCGELRDQEERLENPRYLIAGSTKKIWVDEATVRK